METAALGIVLFAATLASYLVLGWRQRKWEKFERILEQPQSGAAGAEGPDERERSRRLEPLIDWEQEGYSRSTGKILLYMQLLISLLVLLSSLLIILSDSFPADSTKWAFGAVGTIMGYWLRNPGNG